jgi:hypothetical protein
MSAFTEVTYISQFDIKPNGCIGVRKTTDISKDGIIISSTYWRCLMNPSDIVDVIILNEPYYANLAKLAWTSEIISAYQESQVTSL